MTQQSLRKTDIIILGQGFAGSALAWRLHWAGRRIQLIDRGEPVTASRIAAGLITPITGRRMTKAVEFDAQLKEAESFYGDVEAAISGQLLDKQPAVRFFSGDEERTQFMTERWPHLQADVRLIRNLADEVSGFEMLQAARLRVAVFLDATRQYFTERCEFLAADVDPLTDIEVSGEGVRIASLNVSAAHLVFCQGHQRQQNPWFPDVPDGASKGEILTVMLRGRTDQRVTHRGLWLAPVEVSADGKQSATEPTEMFIVGATYDPGDLSDSITAAARLELLSGLAELVSEPVEVLDQVAAVRAGMKQRRPVFAFHPQHPQLSILNGLGSRGALLAPHSAKILATLLIGGCPQPTGKARRNKSLTQLAHSIIRRVLSRGDTAIDATAGNGHDTLFLAQQVGESGIVIAIDLQAEAIAATQNRLSLCGIRNVTCSQADHSVELYRLGGEQVRVKAIMFNLGYLPGSDRTMTTVAQSTITALSAAQCLLSPGGVMTVIAYRGHAEGEQETTAIEEQIRRHTTVGITVDRVNGNDEDDTSPVLFVWRRASIE